nr:5-formyltetrahydrofolate cyclo-ligase [Bradyrhizobium sp. dw_78]
MPALSIERSKAELRATALAARDVLSGAQRIAAAQAIAARGLPFALARGAIVAGYSPIRSEIDPGPLLQRLATEGATLALPVIAGRDQPLRFHAWSAGDELVRGAFGILEPPPEAAEVIPDILLVPLAAFDRAGHRIGYGAGYYDRSLAQLRRSKAVTAVGIAFAVQEIEAVPSLTHDVALDYVLTEAKVFDFRSG